MLPPGVRDRTQKRSKAEKKKAKVPTFESEDEFPDAKSTCRENSS